jgi:glycosyltransferase involved in cell wall biosynthesis
MRRIWIDVEDIFTFFQSGGTRPSGIQRVVGEICQTLHREFGESGQVSFVRHDSTGGLLRILPWPSLSEVFEAMANAPYDPPPMKERLAASKSPLYLGLRRIISRLPPRVRFPIMRFGRAELDALAALTDLFRRNQLGESRQSEHSSAPSAPSHGSPFARAVSAGDVMLMLGAPWLHPGYAERIAKLRRRYRIGFALLVHDIIPLRRPEWVPRDSSLWFRTRFGPLLEQCDNIFATSRASAGDVEDYARKTGLNIPLPVRPLPFGTGFSRGAAAEPEPVPPGFLPDGDYVLFVSTIEVRKNHALLLRVWRRLLEELPRQRVPTLVFAGRSDPSVVDVMRQLVNSDYLDGRIRHLGAPSDAELAALYRGCLFTVFPSFYEGWGLAVSESLSFGKPCIVSNATSLPEAGGSLARYFDPDDATEAYRLIRETIEDRAALRQWQERVCREFRPVSWQQTAGALFETLQITLPAAS